MAGTLSTRTATLTRSATTAVPRRVARRLATVLATLVGLAGLAVLTATTASAQVPPPDAAAAAAAPLSISTPAPTSGFELWAVFLVALASIVVGVALTEGTHRFRQRSVSTLA
jgi:hypothetical protein